MQESSIMVPTAPGELIDKLTILEIKSERITNEDKLKNVRIEYDLLNDIKAKHVPASEQVETLQANLKKINETLWVIEDDIRECERNKQFDETFVKLARSVYITNDKRCEVKREINEHLGSKIIEEKSYEAY